MADQGSPLDSWTTFATEIFKLNGLLMRVGEGISQPLGQSSARWQVLGRAYQPQTVAQMASDLGHARQSVQRIANVLAHEGLVAYREHPTDRRTQLVELTPQGLEVLKAIYERQLQWSQRIVAQLDANQLVELALALADVARLLEADIPASEEEAVPSTTPPQSLRSK